METKQKSKQPIVKQSRIGEWLDANKGGIAIVTDWRAVNK